MVTETIFPPVWIFHSSLRSSSLPAASPRDHLWLSQTYCLCVGWEDSSISFCIRTTSDDLYLSSHSSLLEPCVPACPGLVSPAWDYFPARLQTRGEYAKKKNENRSLPHTVSKSVPDVRERQNFKTFRRKIHNISMTLGQGRISEDIKNTTHSRKKINKFDYIKLHQKMNFPP